jgi:hypothetical protein
MFRTFAAFASGVVVGWVARGVIGGERELMVKTLMAVHLVRERVARAAAEQVEWWQDLVAEARSRIDARDAQPDVDAPAKVIRVA